jgi:hypothetical protein
MEKQIFINGVKTDYSVTDKGIIYSNKFNRKTQISYNNIRGGYKMCYLYLYALVVDAYCLVYAIA